MLLVKTTIGESQVHGVGLFAGQFIPKGTIVWRFTPGFDIKFTGEQILSFPDDVQAYLYKYSWRSKKSKLYCFASDNGKYFNHSNDSNCLSEYRDDEEEAICIAVKDIEVGEEILDNYDSFEEEDSEGEVLNKIADRLHILAEELDPRMNYKIPRS